VEAVLGMLKQRLPAPLASTLECLVGETASGEASGENASAAAAGGEGLAAEASAVLGSLFGSKS
jgi:hypothetical protein